MTITPDQTPVTDDDAREMHAWCESFGPSDENQSPLAKIIRYVRVTLPIPPATLADELRSVARKTKVSAPILALADRVEDIERARKNLIHNCDVLLDKHQAAVNERDEARAEVEQLTSLNAEKNTRIQEQGREIGEYISALNARTSGRTSKESLPVALPDPADVPEDEPWEVAAFGTPAIGLCDGDGTWPWSLAYTEGRGTGDARDESVTLVSRLVPDVRRVIDRPEDLDKLPDGAVIVGSSKIARVRQGWYWLGTDGEQRVISAGVTLPATVLWEPEVTE